MEWLSRAKPCSKMGYSLMTMAARGREAQQDKATDKRALVAQYTLDPSCHVLRISNTSQAATVKGTMPGDVGSNGSYMLKSCPKQPNNHRSWFTTHSSHGEQVVLSSHCCNAPPAMLTLDNAPQ